MAEVRIIVREGSIIVSCFHKLLLNVANLATQQKIIHFPVAVNWNMQYNHLSGNL